MVIGAQEYVRKAADVRIILRVIGDPLLDERRQPRLIWQTARQAGAHVDAFSAHR